MLSLSLYGQEMSRLNHTGDWEDGRSWVDGTAPSIDNLHSDIVISSGTITTAGSVSFSSYSDLTINGTLVINGNLYFENINNLYISDGGVLIIRGDLIVGNHTDIDVNGYLIVTEDIHKPGTENHGYARSNDNPAHVFVIDDVSARLDDHLFYIIFYKNPPSPVNKYAHSGNAYGDATDLANDPVYQLFISFCRPQTASYSGPICKGGTFTLNASGGHSYTWEGPANFSSNSANPSVSNVNQAMSGVYTVTIRPGDGCPVSAKTVDVVIKSPPEAALTVSENTICADETVVLEGLPAGGDYNILSGHGIITDNRLEGTAPGMLSVRYTTPGECPSSDVKTVTVLDKPVAVPGDDQYLKGVFETKMSAEIVNNAEGKWTIVSGTARIEDVTSPVTNVRSLGIGEIDLLWTVSNGSCEVAAGVKIFVEDIEIPSVITPNNDGRNDFFVVGSGAGHVRLMIINRLGSAEYRNDDYRNEWDGTNSRGEKLPDDTYFYILDFGENIVRKGAVMIKR